MSPNSQPGHKGLTAPSLCEEMQINRISYQDQICLKIESSTPL